MAKKTIITLIDDVDGTHLPEGQGETVQFSLDGVDYEIDLSEYNAGKLRNFMALFVEKARKVARPAQANSQPTRRVRRPRSTTNAPTPPVAATELPELSPEEWGEMAPKKGDSEDTQTRKLRAWCRVVGRRTQGRGGAGRHKDAYREFYANKAAKDPKVLEFKSPIAS